MLAFPVQDQTTTVMQTTFSLAQLADPDVRGSEKILRYALRIECGRRMTSPDEPDRAPSHAASRKIPNEPNKPLSPKDFALDQVRCRRGFRP